MKTVDVAIIGGGVMGASKFYALTYTTAERVILLEKYADAGLVTSNMRNNSQTLHRGEIETNFTLEKALHVRQLADHTKRYLEQHDPEGLMHSAYQKMVIGVGTEEVSGLEARFREFSPHYPNMRYLGFDEIGELEPNVTRGRTSRELSAIYSAEGFAVDYGATAQSFRGCCKIKCQIS